jgi:hypothetical protein
MGIDPKSLPGLVIDNRAAEKSGKWASGNGLEGYIGTEYLYAAPNSTSKIRFGIRVDKTGWYEVRLAYRSHENRSTEVPVEIQHDGGTEQLIVNMREAPSLPAGFRSLGQFEFDKDKGGAVAVFGGPNGHACADAVQVLPAR